MSSRDRVGLLKLMWDLVGTEFAGRQLQYEMFYSAAQHIADVQVFRSFDWERGRKHVRRFAGVPLTSARGPLLVGPLAWPRSASPTARRAT